MTISFVAKSDGTGTSNAYDSSVAVTKPAGTASGDLLVAIIAGTLSGTPAGWTLIHSQASGSTSIGTCYAYYKVAGGSEPSSYTFSFSSSFLAVASISCYRGADTSTPIDSTNKNVAVTTSSTNFNTGSVTASGTQWAVSWAAAYEFGSSSVRTWTEGSGTERSDFGKGASGNPDNTNMLLADSNGVVASGSFSRTQTRSSSSDKGVKGIFLINDSGTSAPADVAGAVSVTAYAATIQKSNSGFGVVDVDAFEPDVLLSIASGSASVTAGAFDPVRGITAGAVSATVAAYSPSVHTEAHARLVEVEVSAKDSVAYYGAPVVRVYFIPNENRTYIVRR